MRQTDFIDKIEQIVIKVLEKRGLLINEWQLGKVATVNTDGTLGVYINGSSTITPNIPSNPDVAFAVGDPVWVHYVNRSPSNLFIPYKRYVG